MDTAFGNLQSNAGRARPKKIDTWTFTFADSSRAKIDVRLIMKGNAPLFEASSQHHLLKGKSWSSSDIAALREDVTQGCHEVASHAFSAGWEPRIVAEVKLYEPRRDAENITQISFTTKPVLLNTSKPADNRGTREIRSSNGSVRTVIERSRGEQLEFDRKSLDPKNLRVAADDEAARKIMAVADENVANVHATLQRFAALLGDAFDPRSPKGAPSPDHLAQLMAQAAKDVTKE